MNVHMRHSACVGGWHKSFDSLVIDECNVIWRAMWLAWAEHGFNCVSFGREVAPPQQNAGTGQAFCP